jgi:hypothetical protein
MHQADDQRVDQRPVTRSSENTAAHQSNVNEPRGRAKEPVRAENTKLALMGANRNSSTSVPGRRACITPRFCASFSSHRQKAVITHATAIKGRSSKRQDSRARPLPSSHGASTIKIDSVGDDPHPGGQGETPKPKMKQNSDTDARRSTITATTASAATKVPMLQSACCRLCKLMAWMSTTNRRILR